MLVCLKRKCRPPQLEESVQACVLGLTLLSANTSEHACAGLDSFAALNIMDHMACLAALGHTVLATLHQPRTAIWDLLHQARRSPVLPRSLMLLVHECSWKRLTCICLLVQLGY